MSEVAKLPRLVPLSLVRTRRGTHIHSAPAAGAKWRTHGLLERRIHLRRKQWSSLRACENFRAKEKSSWCGFRAAAAALQWQAVDEAFLSTPSAHTLRLPSPPRWQWQVCLEETILFCPQGGAGIQRGCPQQQQQLSSSIKRHSSVRASSRRLVWKYTREDLPAPGNHICTHSVLQDGCDCY